MDAARPFAITFLAVVTANGALQAQQPPSTQSPSTQSPSTQSGSVTAADYGKLPLSFQANQGQSDSQVRFLSRGSGYSLYLTDSEAVLTLSRGKSSDVVRMQLTGANGQARVSGTDQLPGISNYFIGNDPAKWRSNIPTCAKVRYTGVYPGVDLIYYGNQGRLEYDFVVAPNADPKKIRLQFAGAQKLAVAPSGDLTVRTRNGEVAFRKPEIYQQSGEKRSQIQGRFTLLADRTVGFQISEYDHRQPLVIDPILVYSTYLGGSTYDIGSSIAVDSTGSAYLAGLTSSTDFPTTNGTLQTSLTNEVEFVTKLNPAGTALVYSTFLGGAGSSGDYGMSLPALAIDSSGDAYIAGSTSATTFPITTGAFQTTNGGQNAFVSKLNPTGSALIYSTFLGGSYGIYGYDNNGVAFTEGDAAYAIAVDADGDAFVAGRASAPNFPVTTGAYQTSNKAAPYQGSNGFIAKFNPTGTALVYSTYFGGAGDADDPGDFISSIAIDGDGNAYVTGTTYGSVAGTSGAFQSPSSEGAYLENDMNLYYDINPSTFAAKLNPAGTALVYSSNLSGSGNLPYNGQSGWDGAGDIGTAIAVDSQGNAYVTGYTASFNFPTTASAYEPSWNCNLFSATVIPCNNAFVTKLNPAGTALVYSTFLNNGVPTDSYSNYQVPNAIAVDSAGNAYVAGTTAPKWLPLTGYADQRASTSTTTSGFVIKVNPAGTALMYGSYFGGSGTDSINAIQLDSSGNAYVTGSTTSKDFPASTDPYQVTNKARNGTAFVAKLALQESNTSDPLYGTTASISSNVTTQVQGSPIVFTAQIANNAGSPVPHGTVEFTEDGTATQTFELNGAGEVTYSLSSLAPGFHSIVATYPGNSSFAYSTSDFQALVFNSGYYSGFGVSILPHAPAFSPAAGTYVGSQNVTLSDASTGVSLQYSSNGGATWLNYTGPIAVSKSTTILARAVYTDSSQDTLTSSTTTAAYTINATPPAAAAPTFTPTPGTYDAVQTVKIADADTAGLAIYYTTNGAAPTTSSTKYTSAGISVGATETIKAIAVATNYGPSAVASAAYAIHLPLDEPVLSLKSGTYSSMQMVTVTDASSAALIFYTTNGTTPTASDPRYTGPITVSKTETLKVVALATGYPASPVVSATYTIPVSLAEPVLSLKAGTYTGPQTVSVTDASPNALLFYSTNGLTPTASAPRYTGPITITRSETLKVIALATGVTPSVVATATYVIQ